MEPTQRGGSREPLPPLVGGSGSRPYGIGEHSLYPTGFTLQPLNARDFLPVGIGGAATASAPQRGFFFVLIHIEITVEF